MGPDIIRANLAAITGTLVFSLGANNAALPEIFSRGASTLLADVPHVFWIEIAEVRDCYATANTTVHELATRLGLLFAELQVRAELASLGVLHETGSESSWSSLSPLDHRTEALLYAAYRAQHVAEMIRPSLDSGVDVVCHHYSGSSEVYAYQGLGRELGARRIADLSGFATDSLQSNLDDELFCLGAPAARACYDEVNVFR